MNNAHIYRFNERVAINLPCSGTVYMRPLEAFELASALLQVAEDVNARSFTKSKIGTTDVAIERRKKDRG